MNSAIVLNGNDVVQVNNLKRKYNKIINNPNMRILEECEESLLKDRLEYWKGVYKVEDKSSDEIILHHYKNPLTGETLTSIYDTSPFKEFTIKID